MRRSGFRLTVGIAGALALGMLGPLQRAVSVQSRTILEVSGPNYDESDRHILRAFQRSQEGAGAAWRIDAPDGTWSEISFIAVHARYTRGNISYDQPNGRVQITSDRRAYLEIRSCHIFEDEEYGPIEGCFKQHLWKGDDTFTREDHSERASFTGTLVDADGGTCTVEATWDARDDAEIPAFPPHNTVARTRRPATFDMRSSCIGEHHPRGPDDAEIFVDHAVDP